MIALLRFLLALMKTPFKPMWGLEAENAALRQQLIVLSRRMKARPILTNSNRWFFVALYRLFPSILDAIRILQPETLVRKLTLDRQLVWNPELIFTDMDGDNVMMSIQCGQYFGVNGVGSCIWELLKKTTKLSQIITTTYAGFEVDDVTCQAAAAGFIRQVNRMALTN